jgi:hypothetical protein
MKFSFLIASLLFSLAAEALPQPTAHTIPVLCIGRLGEAKLLQNLEFGGANSNKQQIAVYEGVTYSLQLASFKGFIDILLWQEIKNPFGNVTGASYIRSHGGTELDLVDNIKNVTVICSLGGNPP